MSRIATFSSKTKNFFCSICFFFNTMSGLMRCCEGHGAALLPGHTRTASIGNRLASELIFDWFICNFGFFGKSFREVFGGFLNLFSEQLCFPNEISRKNLPKSLLKGLNLPITPFKRPNKPVRSKIPSSAYAFMKTIIVCVPSGDWIATWHVLSKTLRKAKIHHTPLVADRFIWPF